MSVASEPVAGRGRRRGRGGARDPVVTAVPPVVVDATTSISDNPRSESASSVSQSPNGELLSFMREMMREGRELLKSDISELAANLNGRIAEVRSEIPALSGVEEVRQAVMSLATEFRELRESQTANSRRLWQVVTQLQTGGGPSRPQPTDPAREPTGGSDDGVPDTRPIRRVSNRGRRQSEMTESDPYDVKAHKFPAVDILNNECHKSAFKMESFVDVYDLPADFPVARFKKLAIGAAVNDETKTAVRSIPECEDIKEFIAKFKALDPKDEAAIRAKLLAGFQTFLGKPFSDPVFVHIGNRLQVVWTEVRGEHCSGSQMRKMALALLPASVRIARGPDLEPYEHDMSKWIEHFAAIVASARALTAPTDALTDAASAVSERAWMNAFHYSASPAAIEPAPRAQIYAAPVSQQSAPRSNGPLICVVCEDVANPHRASECNEVHEYCKQQHAQLTFVNNQLRRRNADGTPGDRVGIFDLKRLRSAIMGTKLRPAIAPVNSIRCVVDDGDAFFFVPDFEGGASASGSAESCNASHCVDVRMGLVEGGNFTFGGLECRPAKIDQVSVDEVVAAAAAMLDIETKDFSMAVPLILRLVTEVRMKRSAGLDDPVEDAKRRKIGDGWDVEWPPAPNKDNITFRKVPQSRGAASSSASSSSKQSAPKPSGDTPPAGNPKPPLGSRKVDFSEPPKGTGAPTAQPAQPAAGARTTSPKVVRKSKVEPLAAQACTMLMHQVYSKTVEVPMWALVAGGAEFTKRHHEMFSRYIVDPANPTENVDADLKDVAARAMKDLRAAVNNNSLGAFIDQYESGVYEGHEGSFEFEVNHLSCLSVVGVNRAAEIDLGFGSYASPMISPTPELHDAVIGSSNEGLQIPRALVDNGAQICVILWSLVRQVLHIYPMRTDLQLSMRGATGDVEKLMGWVAMPLWYGGLCWNLVFFVRDDREEVARGVRPPFQVLLGSNFIEATRLSTSWDTLGNQWSTLHQDRDDGTTVSVKFRSISAGDPRRKWSGNGGQRVTGGAEARDAPVPPEAQ